MKKIIASAGVAALGAASLYAAPDVGLTPMETSKLWSVSASLRGFYDDNVNTSPDELPVFDAATGTYSKTDPTNDSFGIQVNPGLKLNHLQDQTYIGLAYDYTLRWYEDRDPDDDDHQHVVGFRLAHDFSETFDVDVSNTFIIAQEPEVLGSGSLSGTPLRTDGDNIHNRANVDFNAQLSRVYSILIGYSNDFWDYDEDGDGSRSALLDRMEHFVTFNLRGQVNPTLVGLFGYRFSVRDYDGDDLLVPAGLLPPLGIPTSAVDPEIRNANSHYFYLGADKNWANNVITSLRLGVQYVDFVDAPVNAKDDDAVSPYIDNNISWVYSPGSSVQLGTRYERNPTDLAYGYGLSPVMDQETFALYVAWKHRITAKLSGGVIAQFANSEFEGGSIDGDDEQLYSLGVNLDYQINQYLAAEAGYSFDKLESDVKAIAGGRSFDIRSFDRNRVYIGLRATY